NHTSTLFPYTTLFRSCLKTISYGGRISGGDLANRLALAYPVVEPMLAFLKREKLIEVVGSQGITERQYEYVLSDKGHEKASEARSEEHTSELQSLRHL